MDCLIYCIREIGNLLVYKIYGIQFILIWLLGISLFLTIKMDFINFRLFKDAIKTIIGINTQKNSENTHVVQISPLTAFVTQAAGNLGLGNIAGAAFALHTGGAGVLFWIFISSFFFSIIKFCEITLGHKYRHINELGVVNGGMFYVMQAGLKEKGIFLAKLGKYMAIFTAGLTAAVIASWSFFQLNQIVAIITGGQDFVKAGVYNYEVILWSLVIMGLAGLVLCGGIKRLGKTADMIVPLMAFSYIIICSIIITKYNYNIVSSLKLIFNDAFNAKSVIGGCGVSIIIAIQRMMFATEAGVGTAALVHANSNIKRASQQGIIAIVDCVLIASIICIGGFAVIVSGVEYVNTSQVGIMLMDSVFSGVVPWFHYILIIIAFLFGFTTITSNGYAVQKALGYLFGTKKDKIYLYIFLIITLVISFYESKVLVQIFDVLTMLVLLPNTLVICLLANEVKKDLKEYFAEKK